MRFLIRLIALILVLTSLFLLVYGSYWTNPTAFLTKLKLIMGTLKSEVSTSERGMICDFESTIDILRWKSSGCTLYLADEYRGSGRSSGKLSFNGSTGYKGTKLEDYVFGPGSHRDWSSFERLSFWLRNGWGEGLDLDIQVKDSGERRFHQDVHLEPGAEEHVSIGLEELTDTVDLTCISSIIIGTGESIGEVDVYIDEIKLDGAGDPLGQPYITFSGLEVPPVAYRGSTFTIRGYLRTEKPVPKDYRVFLHIYPEEQASLAETSERIGLINADHDPPVRTSLWKVCVDESIGPLEVYIPEDNPSGTYLIEMGLFNPFSFGKGQREIEYPGAYDFSGSFPKCRYTNPGMSGYVVGRIKVL